MKWEPANSEYPDLLGRQLALSGTSVNEAISDYRTAVRLNPYEARYWLDLAGAYQFTGDTTEQAASVLHAVEADPTTPHIAWEAANFFLVQGDLEKSLRYFQVVLGNDPEAVGSVLELCWRASGDATQIMDHALPPRADLYLSFLGLLVTRQQVAAAESVWNRLIELKQPFSATPALPYFRLLIAQHEVDAAKTAWQQLAKVDPSLEPYLPSQRNLVVNGGFEENLLNGGFDWWFQSYSHAELNIDTNEFRTGTRSLSVTFDGQSVPGPQLVQFIPVKPNTSYEFSVESRTQDIDTASGPRFAITDAYTNQSYVLTDDTLGSTPWRIQEARFQTGSNTKLVMLKIVRDPPQPLIRGKMWIDDVMLTEVTN
ncbi:MAG TPA: carbohydrate binding domain-containing protein [Acidobacteriaceae bacterium]|nr:carbohydrate binding domain-containing protein [Acidobacteriaceae bacterium]